MIIPNEYETIKNNYFAIEDNIKELIKSTNDLSTDIDILKEYNYDPFYHTKEECGMNDGLIELNNSLTNLFNKLNTISQNIKYLKEKRKTAQKQFEEKAKEEARKEARAKEEEKAAKELKSGTPTGAAAGVNNTINSALEKTQEMYAKNTKLEKEMGEKVINNIKNTGADIVKSGGKGLGYALQKTAEPFIGKYYNDSLNNFAKGFSGEDTAGMLDLSHGANMNNRNYIKDTYHLKNWDDPAVSTDKEYLKEKVKAGFDKYGFDIDKIKGYFFKSTSEPVQRLVQNKDFRNILKEHKNEIIAGKDFDAGFPKYGYLGIGNDNNFKNAIGLTNFKHPWFDKQGNLHIKMYDTYDFNEGENWLVEAGRQQMKKGNLKPFFTVHDIIVPKNVLDNIWK